ncbi:GNAT family N-acetyltransferase [Fluviicola taffensis]|uniref:GCN5-related N-acetyltransferase n=1 Tax=Fluviicola taffensis (strain DSM 16823 / NCIMB 13979 / RW262) TaxID=755732 RepID=F2IH22_FLUTR|nr:GNAT family protein [Fluviicola taffensis]AEA45836.1 GCN5-related N-acetyltransferase [Fluviicola taffensis DSM 16823]
MNELILKTNRLVLLELNLADIDKIHTLHSLPETDEFNTMGIPENREVTEKIVTDWLNIQKQESPDRYTFKIECDTDFVGLIGLKNTVISNYRTAEVWYKLHKDFWGNGYATEAVTRILEFCFSELNLHRVESGCAIENIGSIRVLEKVGMIREGRKRKKLPIRGEWKDNYFYAILEEDFRLI